MSQILDCSQLADYKLHQVLNISRCVLPHGSPWQGGSRGGTQEVFQEHTAVTDRVVTPWKVPYGPQV